MVLGSRLGDGSRKTSFQVRNTTDPEDVVGKPFLLEMAMDKDGRSQRIMKRDPFSESRRVDRRKENARYRGLSDARKYAVQRSNFNASFDQNDRKDYSRKSAPVVTQEFRVVRDNRSKQVSEGSIKPDFGQSSVVSIKQVVDDGSDNCSIGNLATSNHSTARSFVEENENVSTIVESISDSHQAHASLENKMPDGQFMPELKLTNSNLSSSVGGGIENNNEMQSSMLASANMAIGMYSASDPVHVPSSDSRFAGTIGAARQVGVVGSQRQPYIHPTIRTSVGNGPFSIHLAEKDLLSSSESFGHAVFAPKSNNLHKIPASEYFFSSISTSRPFTANQYNSKPNQHVVAQQKATLPSKEWRPKSSQRSRVSSPRLHGSSDSIVSAELGAADLSARFSKVNIFDGGHVIIPEHLRVPEAERTRFTFGSFEQEFGSAKTACRNESADNPSMRVPGAVSMGLQENSSGAIADLSNVNLSSSQSDTFLSTTEGDELALPVHTESSSPKNIHSYMDINVVQRHEPSCSPPKPQQKENSPSMNCFLGDDQQNRDCKPFPIAEIDEVAHGYSFPYETLGLNPARSIHQSIGNNVQQHQYPVPQVYPPIHISQFTNFMPYRHVMAPMFVPQMSLPNYPGNPTNLHHSNVNSCMFMPGGNSHIAAGGGLKYTPPQYKAVHAGSPAGYGNYACPVGYTVGVGANGSIVGSAGADDVAGFKYMEDSLYVPNPQVEAADMWQRPRELAGVHPSPYDLSQLAAPQAAYLPTHAGQVPFLGGAHPFLHYPSGSYNASLQGSIAGPPHLLHPQQVPLPGPDAVQVVPASQVGAYQHAQPGHAGRGGWISNF